MPINPIFGFVGVALRPPPVADKGSKALSEITSKRQCIYAQRIATIFQTGRYYPPARRAAVPGSCRKFAVLKAYSARA